MMSITKTFATLGLTLTLAVPATAQLEPQPRVGDPIDGLTASELARFDAGMLEFNEALTAEGGLGPIFNDQSCGSCHNVPFVGGAGSQAVTRFGKAAVGGDPFDPLDELGGSLLQDTAILPECFEVVPPEATVTSFRLTPNATGTGLTEAVPDADILALESSPPHANVSGIARMVQPLEGGPMRVAKFSWKAGVATTLTFSADASKNELGLTNDLAPTENAPNGDVALLGPPTNCDTVPDPEDTGPVGTRRIDRQTDFQRFSAPPPQTPKSGMTGETIFNQINCNSCHVRDWTTGPALGGEAALSNRAIKPYTDFMLHDMGTLGDQIVDGIATENEMKTSALWGVGLRAPIALLHDGSATGGSPEENLEAAILAHDGEAAFAVTGPNSYTDLGPLQQDLLLDFLMSLGQAEFDYEMDHDVDDLDWFFMDFDGWFTGPGSFYTPDDEQAIADIDQDGDFDLRDFGLMQQAFTGQ